MMMPEYSFHFWPFWPAVITFFGFFFLLDLCLRAVALWRAARANHLAWFIALLIFNTVGVLPLIYLLFFAEEKLFANKTYSNKSQSKVKNKPLTKSTSVARKSKKS